MSITAEQQQTIPSRIMRLPEGRQAHRLAACVHLSADGARDFSEADCAQRPFARLDRKRNPDMDR